jgi:outer membrane protein OmpA-like peptidoglycan-associated protein
MRKLIVSVGLILGLIASANAQTKAETPAFKPYWYLGLNGGVNFFMGEGNNFLNKNKPYVSPDKNVGGLGRIALGYNFNPVWGLRGMLGYNAYNWGTVPVATDGSYPKYKFDTENLTVDVMANLSNWFAGYRPDRKLDFSAFAGLGGSYLNDNTQKSSVAGMLRAGVQADYHLSDAVAINLILDGNATTDNYNDLAYTPLAFDAIPEVTVGMTFKLPEAKPKAPKAAEVEPVKTVEPATIKPEEKPVVAKVDTPKVVTPVVPVTPVTKPEVKPEVEKPAVATTDDILNEHIFYTLNQREVASTTQIDNLKRIADYVQRHPEARIIISGFADKNTGSLEANNEISKDRAVNVANKLIREYGVPYKNIWVKWYGSGVQPYLAPAKNRLVIVRSPNAKVVIPEPKVSGVAKKKKTEVVSEVTVDTLAKYKNEGPMYQVIHFTDGSSDVNDKKEQDLIMMAALYLRRHPESRIAVSGYADKASAGESKNAELSKKRAVAVANTLIQRYSIASDRVQVKWFGAQKENGTLPTMNRLVLMETIE